MKKVGLRLLALCLVAAMLLSFAACGGGSDNEDTTTNEVTEAGTEEELTAVRESLIKATEIKGLGDITKMELYENGVRTTSDEYVQAKDNKKIYYADDIKRVVNYADGYILDIPQDWVPDYSMSSLRVRYDTDEVSLIASNEETGARRYSTMEEYLETTYLYLKNEDFQKTNKVTELEEKTVTVDEDWTAYVYRVKLEGCEEGTKCYYTYVDYIKLNKAYHMMFKAIDDRSFEDVYMSFQGIVQKGACVDTKVYPCEDNVNWNEETATYYHNLQEQTTVDWGLFCPQIESNGWSKTIPLIEKKIEYEFPVISQYVHFGTDFPSEFAEKVSSAGRMLQISYQYTTNNNSDLTEYSPMLDIYRGKQDEVLTKFAQAIADYGHPLFFRLNNEMNTDWTSYCGVANMLDPDIFQETWIRLYNIFTETGANQYAMWIFNGFDGSYPPFNWCNYRCYMPDVQYIDLIGLTGYNSSTPEEGSWKTFVELYDNICTGSTCNYSTYFGDWPWIISEFGCEGLDDSPRAEWVTDMFTALGEGKYPNIKVAIWFSANDTDGATGEVTNQFNISGDNDTLKAFKEGLAKTQ